MRRNILRNKLRSSEKARTIVWFCKRVSEVSNSYKKYKIVDRALGLGSVFFRFKMIKNLNIKIEVDIPIADKV